MAVHPPLLNEQLALIAVDPDRGRRKLGTADDLNACLAALLLAELALGGWLTAGSRSRQVSLTGETPSDPVLAAAAGVVADRQPKLKAVMSHMSRGLAERLGTNTWETSVGPWVERGVLAPPGGIIRRHAVVDPGPRDEIVARLRSLALADGSMSPHDALLLSMTGPAGLLEVVAPDRSTRAHARRRIDHALDDPGLDELADVTRAMIREAAAMIATTSVLAAAAVVAD
ncbi:MAG: GPP34 family phosphoprotein [Desertimonas sp.]